MKRNLIILVGIVFIATTAWAQSDRYEKRAIAYTKRLSVSELENGLPAQRFADWFSDAVGSQAKIKWEVNDCGEQTGATADVGHDFPSCVEANAELNDGRTAVVRIAVGTFRKGISGPPAIYYCFVQDRTGIRDVKNLDDLRRVLAENIK
jgi:hypothetical protein